MTFLGILKFQKVKYKNFLKNQNGHKEKNICRCEHVCICVIPIYVGYEKL